MLKPSGAGIWGRCPGSAILAAQLPKIEQDKSNANIGSCAHKVAEVMLRGKEDVGKIYHNVPVTPDIVEKVTAYVEATEVVPHTLQCVEAKVDCSKTYEGMKGSVDLFQFNDPTKHLDVWDLKFGFRYVEVKRNKQMVIYTAAIIDAVLNSKSRPKSITFHIFQPNGYDGEEPHRTWNTTCEEVMEIRNKLIQATVLVHSDNPPLCSGEHCRYCPARYACKTLLESASVDTDMIRDYSHPVDMTVASASVALEFFQAAQKNLKSVMSGLEEFLIFKLKNGESSRKYEYTRSLGNAQWNMSIDDVAMLGEQYGATLVTKKPITPNQAKLLGVPEPIVTALTERPQRGFKLKRISLRKAKRLFGKK